jgi:CubicO group peptidase (beta-lactamase class C family)
MGKMVKVMNKLLIFLLIVLLSSLTGCQKEAVQTDVFPSSEFVKTGAYQGEYFPTLGWRECAPGEVGMDAGILMDLNDEIARLVAENYEIHSVLIIKDGYIVAEQYYSKYFDKETWHKIHSCTKSFTSALIGIAIKEGYIEGTNVKMIDYFQDYEIENISLAKQSITLEHMLTMSAGLDWDELDYLYTDPQNTNYQWRRSDDMIKFVLDRPMEYTPGEVQDYNSGLSELLAAIVQKATGIRADSFALEKLFTPLGIDDFYWPINKNGYARGGGGMRLVPRDMAKLGYLHIKNGNWENKQILSEDWITESGKRQIIARHISNFWYGYQFWVAGDGMMYTALGYAGQWIMIVPELDLVAVFNNHFDEGVEDQESTPARLFYDYVIPSVLE